MCLPDSYRENLFFYGNDFESMKLHQDSQSPIIVHKISTKHLLKKTYTGITYVPF